MEYLFSPCAECREMKDSNLHLPANECERCLAPYQHHEYIQTKVCDECHQTLPRLVRHD